MQPEAMLELWDSEAFEIMDALPPKYLKRKMKQYHLLVKTQPFPTKLVLELVKYHLDLK